MTCVNKILIIVNKFLFELYVVTSWVLLHHAALVLLFCLTWEEKEPKDEQGYYVNSVHIKKYNTIPLDTFYVKK